MKKLLGLLLLFVFAISLIACSSSTTVPSSATKGTSATSAATSGGARYIVVLKSGATAVDASVLGTSLAARPDQSYSHVFAGFAGVLSPAEVKRLSADPHVAYVEPDLIVQAVAPGGSGKPGGGTPPPQVIGWGVDRIDAEKNLGAGGAGVTVAVIDTGIDLDHPDLANADGSSAVIDGANFVRSGYPPDDDNGHGSHVAGIIAARDNTIGYVGVAPKSSLAAVKVLDRRGSGYLSWVIAGIDWVAANAAADNIKVANMSLSARGDSQAMYDAIAAATAAGVTFVVAASNESTNANQYIPAKYDNVICVSALTPTNTFASYSNYGAVVDLIAPGSSVPSLWKSGGYNTISGTSMASPHVAGSAALWFDNHSGGFADAYTALTGSGEAAPPSGWQGDPDGIPEPLVDAQNL